MEGLLSFLLIGGLFYLMMRYGCGAHMIRGGHGGHTAGGEINHLDPVCGMDVDANQGYGKMYQGQLYRFCTRNCLDRFDADPEKYLKQLANSSTGGDS